MFKNIQVIILSDKALKFDLNFIFIIRVKKQNVIALEALTKFRLYLVLESKERISW